MTKKSKRSKKVQTAPYPYCLVAGNPPEMEAELPYSKAKYIPPKDEAIPHWRDLHKKSSVVRDLRKIFHDKSWSFTHWHAALFYMFSEEDLGQFLASPEQAKYYGDGAELFGRLCECFFNWNFSLSLQTMQSNC